LQLHKSCTLKTKTYEKVIDIVEFHLDARINTVYRWCIYPLYLRRTRRPNITFIHYLQHHQAV